jgi:hypothetical protein
MAFELSYNKVPFALDTPELIELLEARLPLGYLRELVPGPLYPTRTTDGLALPVWPRRPEPRIGQFFYPVGASRWAEFHGVVGTKQKDAMLEGTLPELAQAAAAQFVMRADGDSGLNAPSAQFGGGITTTMYMLPPRPLAVYGTKFDGLWLISLVDERYYFQFKAGINYTPTRTTRR